MVLNEVVVFPSDDTLDYLLRVFRNCPFTFDETKWYVTLNECIDPCAVDPSRTYVAKAKSLGYWYNDEVETSSLIMPLESDDLINRMVELRLKNDAVYHPTPLAFMPLVPMMPPLTHRYRAFVNSVSEILLSSEEPLIFTGEVQRVRNFEASPYELYYRDHDLV